MKELLVGLMLSACAAAQAGPAQLYLATEHSPPASMVEDGRVTGFAAEKVHAIMARAGVPYTIEVLPWKRAYSAALERPDACVFSTTRTPERERLFKWVGPTDEADWVLMGRADQLPVVRTLDDARNYRIGTYNGDARDEYLRARGFQVDPAPRDAINPRKLLAGRIDLWAAVVRPGQTFEQYDWAGKIVPVLAFNKVRVYLACHASMPDMLIDRLNAALETMQRDGSLRRIDRKYGQLAARGQTSR